MIKTCKTTPAKWAAALSLGCALLLPSGVNAATFQAEDYSAFYDTTAGNTGGAYRNDNVDIEATSDNGGGYNVGWIDANEWLVYPGVNIATTGDYIINVRVASASGGALSVDFNAGSIPLGQFDIPNTGGWQNWVTVSKTVTLTAGTYDMGVFASTGGWNFNWIEVTPVNNGGGNGGGSATFFQAEDYSNYSDTTPENIGGAYRNDGVDIETTSDANGGHNVGWMENGEWLAYEGLSIPSNGNYIIKARVASPNGGALSFDLNGGGQVLGTMNIPATGGWQNWQTVELSTNINAGTYTLGAFVSTSGFNLNWIEVVAGGDGGNNGGGGGNITWRDEFDTINRDAWNFETGGGGWGNNELQYYTDGQNASIQFDPQAGSNVLVIEARKETGGQCWWGGNCGYTSSRMNTRFKKSFQYGRIEARMKLPRTQGIWPAFWMLGDNFNNVGWPQGGELDIMEHVGTNNITSGALHGPGYSGNTPITGHLEHGTSIDSGYRVYAVEWDTNGIRWFVDGTNFYSVEKWQVQQYGEWVYDQPFWLLLNLAVGGNWPGDPDHANFTTQRFYIDYVRVIQ
ncbi:carbohydrate-binding protein [Saccharophagus degradans]|uniref:carbohydrate-binding protein n=1 Tax=Saccharophagus degradans TaxID=86304 RepID=UPI001C098189|nr:carbohydrate-binding protein [Saccharophagus degradans]MBU2983798.1 carbohydrate-binding protein [Saccharophagus degradans]